MEKNNLCIIITGKMGSGKSTLLNKFRENGYNIIVPYTTRPIREGEVDGVDYHFISKEEFKAKIKANFFAEYEEYDATFGYCMYGTARVDYDAKITILQTNPNAMKKIKELFKGTNTDVKSIYLATSYCTIMKRLSNCRGDKKEEIIDRLKRDEPAFKDIELYSDVVLCGLSPDNTYLDSIFCLGIPEMESNKNK